jgi:hypothetical protein
MLVAVVGVPVLVVQAIEDVDAVLDVTVGPDMPVALRAVDVARDVRRDA